MAPGLSLVDGLSVVTNKSDHRDRLDFDTSGSSFPKEYAKGAFSFFSWGYYL